MAGLGGGSAPPFPSVWRLRFCTRTGRTRARVNVRPAPVPPAFAGVTRVGHDPAPFAARPSGLVQRATNTKGTSHRPHVPSPRPCNRARAQGSGLHRLACQQSRRQGLLDQGRSRMVPPQPQGPVAPARGRANQWPDRVAHAARRRDQGGAARRLAPGEATYETWRGHEGSFWTPEGGPVIDGRGLTVRTERRWRYS